MNDPLADDITAPLSGPWDRFLTAVEPHRPDLWRYTRALTRSAWDAEGLVQNSLGLAFGRLPLYRQPLDLRPYLYRTTTGLWLDALQRAGVDAGSLDEALTMPADVVADAADARDSIELLVGLLAPRQRAVVLLTEVFGFDADQAAAILDTTRTAVDAARHRARARLHRTDLTDPDRHARTASPADPDVLAAYVDAFNRRDPQGIIPLLRQDAVLDVVGHRIDRGRAAVAERLALWTTETERLWADAGELEGRDIVHIFEQSSDHDRALTWLVTLDTAGGRIAALRIHYYCPELIRHAADRVGAAAATHGYRPDPGPTTTL